MRRLLEETARKVVKPGILNFGVVNDVSAPEHIPDKTGRPMLGLVALDEAQVDPEEFITTAGPNVPRRHQNMVFLLVPETTLVKGDHRPDDDMLANQATRALELKDRLEGTATDVLARKILADDPQSFGLSPSSINRDGFTAESRERANALITVVTQVYRNLWFPGPGGKIIRRELSTAGGEGGVPVIEMIKEILDKEGELVTGKHADSATAIASIAMFFFESKDLRSFEEIKTDFACKRAWPVLADIGLLDQLIRSGVRHGAWRLFRMGDADEVRGFEAGEPMRRCLPILRRIVEPVCDKAGVPLDLQRYLTTEGLRMRGNFPLSEDAGAKLALIFHLQDRIKDMDRVELIAYRVAQFTREEAAYWLSRTTSYGDSANRWAVSGLRIMLGGHANDKHVQAMLEKFRIAG